MTNSDQDGDVRYASSIILDGILYEQTYQPDTMEAKYAYLAQDGTIQSTYRVEQNGIVYKPILTSEVINKAIALPTRPIEYGTKKELVNEIKKHIHKHVDIPDIYEDFCAWYIMASHLFDNMASIPYLRFLGDYQTGKSRASKVVAGLCYHPFQFVTPSGASIYRTSQRWKGTLRLDEFDLEKSDYTRDIIKILNAGYEQGNTVPRCSANNYDDIQFFDVYGPKIIATREPFGDISLENRCITVHMRQTGRDDIPRNLTEEYEQEQHHLRNKLLMWRLKNYNTIDISKASQSEIDDVDIRLQQVTEGMRALFADEPDIIAKMHHVLRHHHNKMVAQRAESFDGKLVKALLELRDEGNEYVSAGDIAERMRQQCDIFDNISATKVGKHLSHLGIETVTSRKIDGRSKRCIDWATVPLEQLTRKYTLIEPPKKLR